MKVPEANITMILSERSLDIIFGPLKSYMESMQQEFCI